MSLNSYTSKHVEIPHCEYFQINAQEIILNARYFVCVENKHVNEKKNITQDQQYCNRFAQQHSLV